MNKAFEFQTLRQLFDGTEQIKMLDICDNCHTIYEGIASNAPATAWEVTAIYTKNGEITIEVC